MANFGITTGGVWWPAEVYQAMEDLGYDAVWTGEHILFHRPILDAIPVLSGLAACTSRIRIGSAIILFPPRNPTILAKELASVDVMSDGRLVIGAGAGGDYRLELEACGVARRHGARFSEMIEVMRKYWTQDYVDHAGEFFHLERAGLMEPKPVQPNGPPIWVGGRSSAALRRAVTLGDGYMPYLYHAKRCREAFEEVRHTAESLGVELPKDYGWAAFVYLCMHEDRARARELAIEDLSWRYGRDFTPWIDKYVIMGTPEDCREQLGEFLDAGVEEFIVASIHEHSVERAAVAGPEAAKTVLKTVQRYADELLPFVHGHAPRSPWRRGRADA